MRLICLAGTVFALFGGLVVGCERQPAAQPPVTSANTAPPPAPTQSSATAASEDGASVKRPATVPVATPAKYPEDLDVDPVKDPAVRDRAASLNAIRPEGLKSLKPGDEAVVLVRADRGGGSVYGSGPYTIDSSLRRAVLHAGLLEHNQLGLVRLKVIKTDADHPSVPKNGVTPTAWGKYPASFTLEKLEDH